MQNFFYLLLLIFLMAGFLPVPNHVARADSTQVAPFPPMPEIRDTPENPRTADIPDVPGAPEKEVRDIGKAYVELGDLVINISPPGQDHQSYVRLQITLKVGDAGVVDAIRTHEPAILDAFNVFLRDTRPVDYTSSDKLLTLKARLREIINDVIAPQNVQAVLLEEILVQ